MSSFGNRNLKDCVGQHGCVDIVPRLVGRHRVVVRDNMFKLRSMGTRVVMPR